MRRARIVEQLSFNTWKSVRAKKIIVGPHALDYMCNEERKIFDTTVLINALERERPQFVGLQEDGRYAVYFQRKEHYLKIIVVDKTDRVEVVTFLNTRILPSITHDRP